MSLGFSIGSFRVKPPKGLDLKNIKAASASPMNANPNLSSRMPAPSYQGRGYIHIDLPDDLSTLPTEQQDSPNPAPLPVQEIHIYHHEVKL